MSDAFERERDRVEQITFGRPTPCIVCRATYVIGVATWAPGPKHRIAAGASETSTPIFGFWLCPDHIDVETNEKIIRQAVLRSVRMNGNR